MYSVWMSIILRDGINPQVKGILCDGEKNPLLFDTQLNALKFWKEYKYKFQIDDKYQGKLRATPQVIRDEHPDDVLFPMLESGERVAILPVLGFTLYSDADVGTEIFK